MQTIELAQIDIDNFEDELYCDVSFCAEAEVCGRCGCYKIDCECES